ncbi:UNVERIFIED_CONTAM: hypothetical protein PYX00_008037 [Menopon gallinae]|uniref:Uncharacterized protein n=1 Tax=Menopon gallinae TaxID=328185 RepID=A0AAW2HMR8_9NEOP
MVGCGSCQTRGKMFPKSVWFPVFVLTLKMLQMTAAEDLQMKLGLPVGGEYKGSFQDILKASTEEKLVKDSADSVVDKGAVDGTFPGFISDLSKDPLKAMVKMVDQISGGISKNLPGSDFVPNGIGQPVDFLKVFEYIQNSIDRLGGRGEECASVLNAMDHSAFTFKQMATLLTSMGKMSNLWTKVDMPTVTKCFSVPPLGTTAGTSAPPTTSAAAGDTVFGGGFRA